MVNIVTILLNILKTILYEIFMIVCYINNVYLNYFNRINIIYICTGVTSTCKSILSRSGPLILLR